MHFHQIRVLRSRSSSGSVTVSSEISITLTVAGGGYEVAVDDDPTIALPAEEPPRRPARRQPRRTGAWRPAAEGLVDSVTLQPLTPAEVATHCPRCQAAYSAASLRELAGRNDGRCFACGLRRVTSALRREKR